MINWYGLLANSLWILGLAMALATFSYASWQASLHHEKMRERLKRPEILIAFNLATLLFCIGLAATSDTILEIVIWSVLGFLFLVQIILTVRQNLKSTTELTDISENRL